MDVPEGSQGFVHFLSFRFGSDRAKRGEPEMRQENGAAPTANLRAEDIPLDLHRTDRNCLCLWNVCRAYSQRSDDGGRHRAQQRRLDEVSECTRHAESEAPDNFDFADNDSVDCRQLAAVSGNCDSRD